MAMVVEAGTWDLFVRAVKSEQLVFPDLSVAELGAITIYPDVFGSHFSAKVFWERFGARYVSFDLKGTHGALPLDLGKQLPEQYRGQYDLVTNFGCAEHVETSQYWCWRNAHELCKSGGVMVHSVPEEGSWIKPNHCNIRYTVRWLEGLAVACGYDVRLIDRWENPGLYQVRAIFRKADTPFPTEEEFDAIER